MVLLNASAWSVIGERVQSMGRDLIGAIPTLVAGLVALVVFYLVGKGARTLIRKVSARKGHQNNIAIVLGRLAQGGIVLLGVLIAAVIVFPNFTPASLIQLLGVSSVAIGFAFRDILQNYLAGILLLVTQPFRLGDQIVFGSYEGTVEEIQTRATFLRTYDGRRVVVPNGELFTQSVVVNTAFETRRVEYDVGIGYGDDIAEAKRVILQALGGIDSVMRDPVPEVLAYDLAGSSVVLRVRWWIKSPRRADVLDARDRVLESIKKALVEEGIDLPFPTQHVLLHDQTEDTDGDRRRQREGWPAGKKEVPKQRGIGAALDRITDARARRADDEPRP